VKSCLIVRRVSREAASYELTADSAAEQAVDRDPIGGEQPGAVPITRRRFPRAVCRCGPPGPMEAISHSRLWWHASPGPTRASRQPSTPGITRPGAAGGSAGRPGGGGGGTERLGYPTQKPEALLKRIITASSNEGDVVLDPFCGCRTAIAVAQRLKRRWIGTDITYPAVSLMKYRLHNAFGEEVAETYAVTGEPTTVEDAQALAHDDPYQFQWWAVGLVRARATERERRKGADMGIGGRLYFHDEAPNGKTKQVIVSVKPVTRRCPSARPARRARPRGHTDRRAHQHARTNPADTDRGSQRGVLPLTPDRQGPPPAPASHRRRTAGRQGHRLPGHRWWQRHPSSGRGGRLRIRASSFPCSGQTR
jgi:hypothetical protein